MRDKILEAYDEDEKFLFADGFDKAIIGVEEPSMRIIYSVSKCLKILQEKMTAEEAMDYFSYNVSGSYMGDKTPIWCQDNL